MGDDRPAFVRRLLGAQAWSPTGGVVVGIHPDSRTGALAHQGPADVGDLPPGRQPGWAPGRLSPPAAARVGADRAPRGEPTIRDLDPDPARPATGYSPARE